ELGGRGRASGEAGLLGEIGADGIEIGALRARLGLDSGYVSRMLRALEREGLVRVGVSRDDGRVRRARLTRAGLKERAELDRRADALAASILEPLSARQRAALMTAMSDVERLLEASMVRIAIEDPTTADAAWCINQYFDELTRRFDAGFDPARTIPADAHELAPPSGALVVARLRSRPVGCGAIKLHRDAPAELKRMWIAPSARGLGLGRRLLAALERHAREHGARIVHLETNRNVT